jgi:hypothetical protein
MAGLQQLADALYDSTVNQSWSASLCFPKGWILAPDAHFDPLNMSPNLSTDIFGLTNITMKGLIFRFDPSAYPVTDSFNGEGFKNLTAKLNANAKGYNLVSNGGTSDRSCSLRCEQYLNYTELVSKADPTIGDEKQTPEEYPNSCDENQAPKENQKASHTNDQNNQARSQYLNHPELVKEKWENNFVNRESDSRIGLLLQL